MYVQIIQNYFESVFQNEPRVLLLKIMLKFPLSSQGFSLLWFKPVLE